MKRGVFKPKVAHSRHQERKQGREHKAECDAAKEAHQKRARRRDQREGSRSERGDGKLERDDARCIVNERLARKQNRLATLEAHALRKRSHGHGIGWPERRTKGEGGRKRNGELKGMQGETDAKNGNDHKAHGERKHLRAIRPQGHLVGVTRLVIEQRRDEEHQEQLRVYLEIRRCKAGKRKQHADADLNKRGCDAAHDLVDGARDENRGTKDEYEGKSAH